jgi:hypothetical protein
MKPLTLWSTIFVALKAITLFSGGCAFYYRTCTGKVTGRTCSRQSTEIRRGPIDTYTGTTVVKRSGCLGGSLIKAAPVVPLSVFMSANVPATSNNIFSVGLTYARRTLGKYYAPLTSSVALVAKNICPSELAFFLAFQILTSRRILWRLSHNAQCYIWRMLHLGEPLQYEDSILGFLESRTALLAKLIGSNYAFKLLLKVLCRVGLRVNPDPISLILAKVSYVQDTIPYDFSAVVE